MPASHLPVLLVEDNKTISENLIDALEEMVDARVAHVAAGEKDACDWISAHDEWAVAVVDLFLNEGSGLGVLRALQERRRTQCVVVLSNYATSEMRAQCLHLGADRVFDKSTELDQFIEYCLIQREARS